MTWNQLHNMRKHFQVYLHAFDYPSYPSDSLILSSFTTLYLGSPRLSSRDAVTLLKATATLSQTMLQWFFNNVVEQHISAEVSACLNAVFPSKQIGYMNNCMAPTFPRPKPSDFRVWEFMDDDVVYIPPMSTVLCELQQHIKGSANKMHWNMVWLMWKELGYQWDICRLNKGGSSY